MACSPSELVSLVFKLKESYTKAEVKEPYATKVHLHQVIRSLLKKYGEISESAVSELNGDADAEEGDNDIKGAAATKQSSSNGSATSAVSSGSQELGWTRAQDERSEEQIGADYRALMQTQMSHVTASSEAAGDDEDDNELNSLLYTQTQAEFKLVEAKRATQYARQNAALEKERQSIERRQVREREVEARRAAYEKKTGRPPPCPLMSRSQECNSTQCKDIGNGRFSHPERCRNPKHVVQGQVGDCVLWHFWANMPPKPAGNGHRGTSSSNGNGKLSQSRGNGGVHPRKINGTNDGKVNHGRARQPRQWQQQQQKGDSKAMAEVKAELAEMKALLALRSQLSEEVWPLLADPAKSLLSTTSLTKPPPALPSAEAALKQIATLLAAFK
jgi:hypothetical protein